jgi:hypothetical protein
MYIVKNVPDGHQVILSAAQSGWTFLPYTVPVHAGEITAQSVRGSSVTRTVSVNLAGSGSGGVTSSPANITCTYPPQGGSCSSTFPNTVQATLTATALSGSTFAGWGGDCAYCTYPVCEMNLDADKSCTALFNRPDFALYGTVRDVNSAPIAGASVQVEGVPACSVQSAADGSYSLGCIPYDADFVLKISKPGYLPVYSQNIRITASLSGADYKLRTIVQAPCGGSTAGKGTILAQVSDNARAPLAGVIVAATGGLHGAYPVQYFDGVSTCGGGATGASGLVVITNVDNNDSVTLNASKVGWSFIPSAALGRADSLTDAGVVGTILYGDVNNDNVVNVFDALLALQYAVGLYRPTDEAAFKAAADVAPLDAGGKPKGDSEVNVFDALAILRHAVGLDGW